jgi:hypothetical protein
MLLGQGKRKELFQAQDGGKNLKFRQFFLLVLCYRAVMYNGVLSRRI